MFQRILQDNYSFGLASGSLFFLVFLYFRTIAIFKVEYQKSSLACASLYYVREKYLAYKYLFRGSKIIETLYKKSGGKSFEVKTPEKINIMVTSQKHITELNKAPRHQLSLHAVAKEFLQPKYTMHGFEWKDQRGIEGTGFVRALRDLLTGRLPLIIPALYDVIQDQIKAEISDSENKYGWNIIPLFAAMKRMVSRANASVFFPLELSENPNFVKAAIEFPEDVYLAAEIIRIFPRYVGPKLARFATRGHRSTVIMHELLCPVVQRRMDQANLSPEDREDEPNDGVQWLINTTPKCESWNVERLVGEIMAVWYGSLHTLAIATTYAVHDLYSRPEYILSLRREADGPLFDQFKTTSRGLPEMDSFLKESARFSAFESTGVRRHALEEFRFSDGLRVPKGSWVCVPHRAMMHDNFYFENASQFDGYRFLNQRSQQKTQEEISSKLTDRSDTWLVWGAGRISWEILRSRGPKISLGGPVKQLRVRTGTFGGFKVFPVENSADTKVFYHIANQAPK